MPPSLLCSMFAQHRFVLSRRRLRITISGIAQVTIQKKHAGRKVLSVPTVTRAARAAGSTRASPASPPPAGRTKHTPAIRHAHAFGLDGRFFRYSFAIGFLALPVAVNRIL